MIHASITPFPRFLDVEASSLSLSSYPIEIAWSDENGCNINSYLINPSHINSWIDWSTESEKLHGINQKQCLDEGIHPAILCRIMSKSISPGKIIYADGGQFDQDWIDILFSKGSKLGYSQFRVIHSDVLMLPLLEKIENDQYKRLKLYEFFKNEARKKVGAHHRASLDVRFLIELYLLCLSFSRC